MTLRMGLYCRISKDRIGAGLGVARQATECQELAARNGWTIVARHVDNDLSAYSGKPRPGYRALLDDIQAGRVDAVLAWHTDRLHRSPAELEEYITICEGRSVATMTVRAGELDLSTASGRMVARMHGAVARHEVDRMIERQRSAKLQAAGDGRWKGGRRPYGFEDDGVTVRQDEADELLRASKQILAGVSLRALVRDLNNRGLTTSTGGPWRNDAIRALLLRPRNAGLMEHRGEVIGPAGWPAIVPEPLWRAVVAKLTNPARRSNGPNTAKRWLGSGLYLCGVCGGVIRAVPETTKKGKPYPAMYQCVQAKHVVRKVLEVDEYISALVIAALSAPDAAKIWAPSKKPSRAEARAAKLRERLDELAQDRAADLITRSQLLEGSAAIRAKLAEVEAEMADAGRESVLGDLVGADDVAAKWKALSLDRKRAVIDIMMVVTLLPSPKGRPPGWRQGESYFRPETVRIDWR